MFPVVAKFNLFKNTNVSVCFWQTGDYSWTERRDAMFQQMFGYFVYASFYVISLSEVNAICSWKAKMWPQNQNEKKEEFHITEANKDQTWKFPYSQKNPRLLRLVLL